MHIRMSSALWLLTLLALSRLGMAESFRISTACRSQRFHLKLSAKTSDDADSGAKIKQHRTRFAGVGRLYVREDNLEKTASEPHFDVIDRLAASTVAVFGLGGVGSWAAEALCRSGVGSLILIDLDDICTSNTNRQLHATSSTIGKMKIDQMKERILDINPQCNVMNIYDFVSGNNVHEMLELMLPDLDVCVDAIDGAKEKTALLAECVERKIPIVTCGAAAGKIDTTRVVVEDLTRVSGDPLLARCRKELRRRHGFGKGISYHAAIITNKKPRKWRIPAVYSTELTQQVTDNDSSSLRRCDGALGTACFVTGTFGFAAASEVVRMIATSQLPRPRKNG